MICMILMIFVIMNDDLHSINGLVYQKLSCTTICALFAGDSIVVAEFEAI